MSNNPSKRRKNIGTRMFYPEACKVYEKWSETAGDNPIIMADASFETFLAGWQAALRWKATPDDR